MIIQTSSQATARREFLQSRTLFVLFTLSGFVGVLAEQVFEKMLSVVVGGTTPAAATVISVYFIGLSAGGWLSSVLLKKVRSSSLRLYGICELGVPAGCLLVWLTFDRLAPWFAPPLAACGADAVCLSLTRAGIAAVFILPTAVCLGLSFPFLSDLASRHEAPAHFLAKLYFTNLLGAALCALLAPYLIFPWIGLSGAILIAAALDLAVGLAALALAKSIVLRSPRAAEELKAQGPAEGRQWLILGIAFLSGLIFFSFEVLWTHLTGVVAGLSVYAFSSMLFVVLLGLALGSIRVATEARQGKPPRKIGMLFFLCASLVLLQLVFWPYVPSAIFLIGSYATGFYTGELARLLTLTALLLPFTYAYGMIYPCLFNESRLGAKGGGRLIGYMGFANAIGCVIGAGAGFFYLIPALGSEQALRVMTVTLALCGVAMLWIERDQKNFRPSLVSTGILSAIALLYPAWNRLDLTAGSYLYFGRITRAPAKAASQPAAAPKKPALRTSSIVFFHEDSYGGITTVQEEREDDASVKVLLTNGKFQGDDGRERKAQIGFALIPTLHLAHRDRALTIGCGTGQSSGVLDALGFEQIHIAELAPGILDGAKAHFSHVNRNIFNSPRLTLFVEDGRNILLRRSDTYDLITIEVSSIWFAGATNIYSHEFYDLAKSRLRPGGKLQQWIQLHHISPREVRSIIGTVRASFPYVSLWFYGGQGQIIAGMEPLEIQPEARATVQDFYAQRAGGDLDAGRKDYEEALQSILLTSQDVDRMLAAHPPVINTDWNRFLEYATPRYNVTLVDWGAVNLAALKSFSSSAAR